MPYRPFEGQNCSVAAALAVVGERWTLLIVREVLGGHRRFEDIRRRTGIAPNILSDRLATLVEHELLRREPVDGEPDVFEYRPTRKGVDINPVLLTLMAWGDRYAAPDGPPRVPVHATCGHDAAPQLHCSHCGDPLQPPDLEMHPGPGAVAGQL
jgi:DNA-binding HxlR family transcriptional regulator